MIKKNKNKTKNKDKKRKKDDDRFIAGKRKALGKNDLSRKGYVDDEIKEIVDLINSYDEYYTTSSCAGRITLLERSGEKKINAKWLLSSHQPIDSKKAFEYFESEYDVWLMQESCILHVCCKTIDSAEKFLKICRKAGFKRSGIITLSNRIIIETMGNEKVEALVIKDGKKLCNEESFKILVNESNSRMLKNREKMNLLLKELKALE